MVTRQSSKQRSMGGGTLGRCLEPGGAAPGSVGEALSASQGRERDFCGSCTVVQPSAQGQYCSQLCVKQVFRWGLVSLLTWTQNASPVITLVLG